MNIVIRHAEPDDYLAISQIYSNPQAAAGTLQIPLSSQDMWKKRYAGLTAPDRVLVALVDGELVGHIGLHPSPNPRRAHTAHVGMAVRDDWHGKGIGKVLLRSAVDVADNWLGLLRLELTVWTDNTVAQRLYTSEGFVPEGTHRAYALRNGQFTDALAMARLNPKPPSL